MAYEVRYDDGVQQWSAFFESEEEALSQAVEEVTAYGGVSPQEIMDGRGVQVADQAAIEAAAAG
jgi:hypothetical protein